MRIEGVEGVRRCATEHPEKGSAQQLRSHKPPAHEATAPMCRRRDREPDELSPRGIAAACDSTAIPPVRVEAMERLELRSEEDLQDSPPEGFQSSPLLAFQRMVQLPECQEEAPEHQRPQDD